MSCDWYKKMAGMNQTQGIGMIKAGRGINVRGKSKRLSVKEEKNEVIRL